MTIQRLIKVPISRPVGAIQYGVATIYARTEEEARERVKFGECASLEWDEPVPVTDGTEGEITIRED